MPRDGRLDLRPLRRNRHRQRTHLPWCAMTTALVEAGFAVTAGLAATVRGGCYLLWVWRHRGDYPNRPGRTK